MTVDDRLRSVAFYLPQFHPTTENDGWWGPGFTEWHTVAKARPLFRGHQQPRLPGQLGFYDLRHAETRAEQAALASTHGIDGFCYWHYWFSGVRVLDRVAQEVLESAAPDFGFCFAWANEPWTRVWSGQPRQELMPMRYPGDDDEKAHFSFVEPYFHDPRYTRVDGRPVFVIYRPHLIPGVAAFLQHWRRLAQLSGLGDLYFVGEIDSAVGDVGGLLGAGFDALIDVSWTRLLGRLGTLRKRVPPRPLRMEFTRATRRWEDMADEPRLYGCVLTGWDNSPRRNRTGWLLKGVTPAAFEAHVHRLALRSQRLNQPLLFVKSWNEWSEGNYLEPDRERGTSLLEAFSRGVERGIDG